MPEDTELLRRYADERSEAAFAELVRRRLGLVYSVALRQVGGDSHLAEDVTQRVFSDLARKAASLSSRPSLSAWLYRSAQFAASDVVRAERRRRAREQEAQVMHELTSASAQNIEWEKLGPVLDQVMNELKERDRDAVALRFFESCAFAEIGAKLRLTEDAARMRVDRALEKMRTLLAKRNVISTSGALAIALADQACAFAAPAGLAASITAAATASGVATSGVLAFLAMTKLKTATAIFAVSVAMMGSGYLATVWRHQEGTLLEARRNFAAAQASREITTLLESKLVTAERNFEDISGRLADARARLAARATQARPTTSLADRMRRQTELMSRDPEFAMFRQATDRRVIQKQNGDIFAELNLSSGNLEALKRLLLSEITTRRVIWQELVDAGVTSGAEADEVFAEFHATIETRIGGLLGDEKFEIFKLGQTIEKKYQPAIDELNLDLADAGIPLTATQAKALARVFCATAEESSVSSHNAVATPSGLRALEALRLESAAEFLSPEQIKAAAAFFIWEREKRSLEKKSIEASANTTG